MWVFDGEEWTDDSNATAKPVTPATRAPEWTEEMPELQVIEHVPTPAKATWIPPFPLT